jgi:hypothetical protein
VARAEDFDDESGGDTGRTARTDAFWAEMKIDPIEIALPSGVGYTLRAYRMSSEITPTDTSAREADLEMPAYRTAFDDEDDTDVEDTADASKAADSDFPLGEPDEDEANVEEDEEIALVEDEVDESEEELEEIDEEIPIFLSHAGSLLLFKTSDGLVEFVKSGADNDLTQLDEWAKLASGLRPEQVVALPDDQYELDLVVNNLRGGPDAWDANLIVQSGQVARDLGYALRIEPVLLALSPGSPLDDLDEALRGVAAGGVGTFFARRRARKVGKETASLAWRTVIGKISAVVDWRD